MNESSVISWIRQRTGIHTQVPLGIGDDAAELILVDGKSALVTADMLMEGCHFEFSSMSPFDVGRKAMAVNLSDIAAMGARPVAAFICVALPRTRGMELASQVFEGALSLASEFDTEIAGGDTNTWDGPLVISVTLIGEPSKKGALTRAGAQDGDQILVTGTLGGSRQGHHFAFTPRIQEARLLHDRYELTSMVDLSDGLAKDLGHIVEESACGAVLDRDAIPISEAARDIEDSTSPLDHALCDGEDFEICFTASPDEAARILRDQPLKIPITSIGTIWRNLGLWWRGDPPEQLHLKGFEHPLE